MGEDTSSVRDPAVPHERLEYLAEDLHLLGMGHKAAKVVANGLTAYRDAVALRAVLSQRADLLEAIRLILPLAKGYNPDNQSDTARATCRSWIEHAEAAIAKAEGRPPVGVLAAPLEGEI